MIFSYIKCKNCFKRFDNLNTSKCLVIETPFGDAKRIDIISTKNLVINNLNEIRCKKCKSKVGFVNNNHKILLNNKCIFF